MNKKLKIDGGSKLEVLVQREKWADEELREDIYELVNHKKDVKMGENVLEINLQGSKNRH